MLRAAARIFGLTFAVAIVSPSLTSCTPDFLQPNSSSSPPAIQQNGCARTSNNSCLFCVYLSNLPKMRVTDPANPQPWNGTVRGYSAVLQFKTMHRSPGYSQGTPR
ncbi:hypothetical protein H4582DRAFT_1977832 [Lactarius indigo]|nr:hypothetical protein H4582DRAFT_1977832 [Lactarius indigo]